MNSSTPLPQRIAKYEIHCVLGRGAMGVVYKGYDKQIERPVAIKILHPHLREGEQGKDLETRFVQEARAAARCLHPNIATIFDFGGGDPPYIVMEYVEGIALNALLKSDTNIEPPSATDITIQVLRALDHAHSRGIVHRDIKPANIILLEDGGIKVSDFGVAHLDTSELTGTGFVVGTPSYLSPEGLLGKPVDKRSDLYSVGVLFYELLTRQRPSREQSLDQSLDSLDQVRQLSRQSLRSIKPILRKALQHEPGDRYQSAEVFIEALQAIDDMDLTLATTAHFPRLDDYKAEVGTPSGDSASQWSDELLSSLEQSLARYVGPVARLLVKKSSRSSGNMNELLSELTAHIPSEEERSRFMQGVASSGIREAEALSSGRPSAANHGPAGAATGPALSERQQQQLTQLLAFHTGPLAGRQVKAACRKHASLQAVASELAGAIPDESERAQFLAAAGRLEP